MDRKARYQRFFDSCRLLAEALDTRDRQLEMTHKCGWHLGKYDGPCYTYSDEVIEVVSAKEGGAFSVEKVENGNPVICCGPDGDPFRTHGEMWDLEKHVLDLVNPLKLLARQAED